MDIVLRKDTSNHTTIQERLNKQYAIDQVKVPPFQTIKRLFKHNLTIQDIDKRNVICSERKGFNPRKFVHRVNNSRIKEQYNRVFGVVTKQELKIKSTTSFW